MKSMCILLLSLNILTGFVCSSDVYAEVPLKSVNLKVEYQTNPVGIDILTPRLSWEIVSDTRNTRQTAYEIQTAASEKDLNNEMNLIWQKKVDFGQSVHIPYEGPALESRQRVYWRIRVWDNHGRVSGWSAPAFWEMGLLKTEDWKARWIEADIAENPKISEPAPYFRHEFELDKPIQSARLYITSHGLNEAFLNGTVVGDRVFTPGWTSYNKRLQYDVYDVTKLLEEGDNAIGITLGDGWYRGFLAWRNNRNVYGDKLAALAQLEVTHEDGSRSRIITDDTWKATNNGPIRMSDIYMGESYDARKEMPGWTMVGFNDDNWKKVIARNHPKEHLVACYGPPVKRIEELQPVRIIPQENNTHIIDMGQNLVGRVRLTVDVPSGTTIQLRHAEVLDKNGNFYTENLRAAKQLLTYTARGDGMEVYEPHFTFQGFRFVEVSGLPYAPTPETVTGIVIHSDMTPVGTFTCSDSLINQLQHNIQWGLKGNFLDVPTDCPQRDERLGWTGDAQVFAPTACFNMDAATFYTKWLKDLALDQTEEGKITDVVPDVLNGGGAHTGWADAGVVIPWVVYLNYGDKRILEDQYPSMRKWIAYMKSRSGEGFLWLNDWHYGDWLSYDDSHPAYMGAYTETDLLASAYFAWSSTLLGKIARILGKEEDAREYADLAANIKSAFQKEFLTPNGRLVSHTQTAYTLALAFDLLPESIRPKSAEYLNSNVNRFKHITTGFLGTPLISQILTTHGYPETAYMLLNRKEYPSWLYPVTMGATTIWERWDGIKPDSTFQDKGMNSFNHYAYGAIGKWLYSTVAGIDIDEGDPGYKSILFKPLPGGGLTHARAEIHTMYGPASSSWKWEEGLMNYTVVIPPNTSGNVHLPVLNVEDVQMEGQRLDKYEGIERMKNQEGHPVINIGSGRYTFDFPFQFAVEEE